jgi:hypothetical protein
MSGLSGLSNHARERSFLPPAAPSGFPVSPLCAVIVKNPPLCRRRGRDGCFAALIVYRTPQSESVLQPKSSQSPGFLGKPVSIGISDMKKRNRFVGSSA